MTSITIEPHRLEEPCHTCGHIRGRHQTSYRGTGRRCSDRGCGCAGFRRPPLLARIRDGIREEFDL